MCGSQGAVSEGNGMDSGISGAPGDAGEKAGDGTGKAVSVGTKAGAAC